MNSGAGVGGYSKSMLEMITDRLNYQSPLTLESGVTARHEVVLHPNCNARDWVSGPMEFYAPADRSMFTDSHSFKLHGKVGMEVLDNSTNKWISLHQKIEDLKEEQQKQQDEQQQNEQQQNETETEEDDDQQEEQIGNKRPPPSSSTQSTAKRLKRDLDLKLLGPSVGVVNNFFSSLISSLEVKLNDAKIGDGSTGSYAYMAYVQKLLGIPTNQSGSEILKTQMFIKDPPGGMKTPLIAEESGYSTRRGMLASGHWIDFHEPLYSDLTTCEKYLPPDVKLSFTFRRTSEDFAVWQSKGSEDKCRIVLKDIYMTVDRLEVKDVHLKNWQNIVKAGKPVEIRFTESVLKTFAIPKGTRELSHHNLYMTDQLPDKVYAFIVEQDAYNGHREKNPYYFEYPELSEVHLNVNGINEPNPGYRMDEEERYSAFLLFLANTGTNHFETESVNISYKDYMDGTFIAAFDRSPTRDNGLYTNPPQSGSMSISMRTSKKTKDNYVVLTIASFERLLVIDGDRVSIKPLYNK